MIDTVRINVKAGNGGDGCISFLRLKYLPRGGPDGGDGGDGGSAYIVGDSSLNTLLHLKFNSTFYLERGTHGKGKDQRGANGKDTEIRVPLGTVVWRLHRDGSKDFMADVVSDEPVWLPRAVREVGATPGTCRQPTRSRCWPSPATRATTRYFG